MLINEVYLAGLPGGGSTGIGAIPEGRNYDDGTNYALAANGGVVTAESEGSYGFTRYARYAIDGHNGTSWTNRGTMPTWIQVEFNEVETLSSVGIIWSQGTHKQKFEILTSIDGHNWNTVVSPDG